MRIRFRQSVAHTRGAFRAGQVVSVPMLPAGWDAWLKAGVIVLVAEDLDERAVAPGLPEAAVRPSGRSRRAARRAQVAG